MIIYCENCNTNDVGPMSRGFILDMLKPGNTLNTRRPLCYECNAIGRLQPWQWYDRIGPMFRKKVVDFFNPTNLRGDPISPVLNSHEANPNSHDAGAYRLGCVLLPDGSWDHVEGCV